MAKKRLNRRLIVMNEESMTLEEKLGANAEMVIAHLSQHAGFTLGFNEASVEWIDGFIERQRMREGKEPGGLVNTLGSFLGECFCREYGGAWHQSSNGQLSVKFSDGNEAFPFNKVAKQFANGAEDSISELLQNRRRRFRLTEKQFC